MGIRRAAAFAFAAVPLERREAPDEVREVTRTLLRTPMRLLYAARSVDDVILLPELLAHEARGDGFGVRLALSRSAVAPRAVDHAGRLDTAVLQDALEALGESAPIIYLCGSHRFVEGITAMLGLMDLGGADVRTERFGG
jgi:ferredoxin-NADP reductase